MKILKIGVLALSLSAIGFINIAVADNHGHMRMGPCQMMQDLKACSQYQALTSDQKTKVDKITQNFKKQNEPLMKQMLAKHKELNNLFAQPTLDEKAIDSLSSEISSLHDQIFAAHIKARIEMTKAGFSIGECCKTMHPMMQQMM